MQSYVLKPILYSNSISSERYLHVVFCQFEITLMFANMYNIWYP